MISGSKIESADFYLPSTGYRILFKNDFLLFQFCFKPKISSHKLFPSDSSKNQAENKPLQKTVQKSLWQCKIMIKLNLENVVAWQRPLTSLSCYVTRAWENKSAMPFGRSALSREDIFQIQLLLADGNFELFSFSTYFLACVAGSLVPAK